MHLQASGRSGGPARRVLRFSAVPFFPHPDAPLFRYSSSTKRVLGHRWVRSWSVGRASELRAFTFARLARRQAPTAQYGELGQAKAQARTRVVEAKFSYIGMSVGRVLDASPQTARGSRGSGAILRLPTPKNRYQVPSRRGRRVGSGSGPPYGTCGATSQPRGGG